MRAFFITADRLAPRSGLTKLATIYSAGLRQRFGMTIETANGVPLRDLAAAVRRVDSDLVVLALSWGQTPDEAMGAVREIRERNPRTRIVFFDWYDSTSSPHFGVLPYVDAYAKGQILRDLAWYGAGLRGYAFTDFLS